MSFSHRLQKNILQTIVLIVCLLTPSQVLSFSFNSALASGWIKLTTPISSFFCGAKITEGMPFVITNENSKIATFGIIGSIHALPAIVDNYSIHDNYPFQIITFFNNESQRNLNSAYVGGRYFLPYSVFTYEIISGDWYYWARHSDAFSVLLYGYSWLINIPAKILNEIDSLIAIDKSKNYGFGTSEIASLSSHRLACFIDIIINSCSLVFEIPIAIANTIVGTVIALFTHPVDSICSIMGFIYFVILSTVFAIWDIVSDIPLIIYHLAHVW